MSDLSPHYAAALDFLNRDPYANRELLLALRYEAVTELHVVFDRTQPTGVLLRGPNPFNLVSNIIRLDALDAPTVHQLLSLITPSPELQLSVHRPWIGELLSQSYGWQPTGRGMYGYLLAVDNLVFQPHPAARVLQPQEWPLVARSACGWTHSYFTQLFDQGREPWAIVLDGRIVCRASSGYPQAESEEVVGVWTHPQWRGRGLARQLVSHVAAHILTRCQYAVYTTTYDNLASQAVAGAVGFRRCFTADEYIQSASVAQGQPAHS